MVSHQQTSQTSCKPYRTVLKRTMYTFERPANRTVPYIPLKGVYGTYGTLRLHEQVERRCVPSKKTPITLITVLATLAEDVPAGGKS